MSVIKNYGFPRYVYDLLKGKGYSIGIHGISIDKAPGGVESAIESILNEGLRIEDSRTINGTVDFDGRIDNKEDIKYISEQLRGYRYGDSDTYLLVAIPTVIKNKAGDTIYIGNNGVNKSFKEKYSLDGYEVTSLMDEVIPKINKDDVYVLPGEYILGSYKILSNGAIDFNLNTNHVAVKKGISSDEEFDRIDCKLKESVYGLKEAYDLLKKKELTEEDYQTLDKMKDRLGNMMQAFNRFYLIPFINTLKQLSSERDIVKTLPEDVDKCNEIPKSIDYSKYYEGKVGEELFNAQLEVIKGMEVEFFDDNGAIKVYSDRDGEAEEFYRLLNDKDFVVGLLTHLNRWELIEFEQAMCWLSKDEILTDETVALKLLKDNMYAASNYNSRGLLSRELLMKAAKSSCFTKDTLYYLPEEYTNDLELILAFVDNANENNYGFSNGFGDSKFTFFNLSEEVRSNPELYERLNKKITELNTTKGTEIPLFNVDEEVKFVKGNHR